MSRANQPDPDEVDADAAADGTPESADEQWRFGIDDVGPDGIVEETSPEDGPIEPENVSFEHAAFVALGVVIAVGAVLTILL